jgi:tetratricopeptide (TPR) repeat protein
VGLTKEQRRLASRLIELQDASDWRGVVALEHEALALVQELRVTHPGLAGKIQGLLGLGFRNMRQYTRALALHEQHRAMEEALGDRAGVATACGNLGICLIDTGEYERARVLLEQQKAICEELGNRVGAATACGNLGCGYYATGDYGRAREMQEQCKAMCEEIGDRVGVLSACNNLGKCYLNTGEYAKAISYFTETYNLAKELQVGKDEIDAALGMGVALRLAFRVNLRVRALAASQLSGPLLSASACGDDGVREAEKWLQTALDGGVTTARLHLAHLAFDAGQEDTALAHLKDYLSWCVERGRDWCAGCQQKRGEDAQMLTCGGCRVARFCNADHQKMASRTKPSGGALLRWGRHKDMCALLGKWRQQIVKDGMSPDSCREDLLEFLQR